MAQLARSTRPIRVGIFGTVSGADRAVHDLMAARFSEKEISVLCSAKYKERFFPDLPTATAPGAPPGAIAAGGAIGATIGGLALATTALLTGGATLLAAGAVLLGGGALAGGFTGAMVSLGYDPAIAEQYDRALREGKVVVAVEVHGEHSDARLAEAEHLLDEAGARRMMAVPTPI